METLTGYEAVSCRVQWVHIFVQSRHMEYATLVFNQSGIGATVSCEIGETTFPAKSADNTETRNESKARTRVLVNMTHYWVQVQYAVISGSTSETSMAMQITE